MRRRWRRYLKPCGLCASPQLDREVILLITDGEEKGLLGARGLFEGPQGGAWQQRIGVVMNFEARGTCGPSIMFETAPHNLSFIRHFAAATPNPMANSLSYDVYRLLPNNTDFTVFRMAGLKGLNFGFIGNYFYYHTPKDSLENLNAASLYHHGSAALALTRHFANLSDADLEGLLADDQPDAVYFNISPTVLVRYSAKWIWPLTLLQLLLTAMRWCGRSVERHWGAGLGGRGGTAAAGDGGYTRGGVWNDQALPIVRTLAAFNLQLGAVAALSTLITLSLALECRRVVRVMDLAAAGLILFSLFSMAIDWFVPGGSFLTTWPAIFATAGFAAAGHFKDPRMGGWRWAC